MQTEVQLDFYLENFYFKAGLAIHYFNDFESLVSTCQQFTIDVVIMATRLKLEREIEFVKLMKLNTSLASIPVILYHPEPSRNDMIAAYQNGADDFIHGEWIEKLVQVRIDRVIDNSRRDLAVNPSTRLPGPTIIDSEIGRQLAEGAQVAICYADLDNFKAYNDYYGYYYGDGVIQLTARVIKDVVYDLCPSAFVGHVAGDDFIFTIAIDQIDDVCENILRTFDSLVPYRYELADRERGTITTVSRRGEVEVFPLLTLSIAVVVNRNGQFKHIGELSKMLADLKKATKNLTGSNYLVERRVKY